MKMNIFYLVRVHSPLSLFSVCVPPPSAVVVITVSAVFRVGSEDAASGGVGEAEEEGGGARGRLPRGLCVGAGSGRRRHGLRRPAAPGPGALPDSIAPTPATSASTLCQFFRRPFPPPSLAKHIKESLARRLGRRSPASAS